MHSNQYRAGVLEGSNTTPKGLVAYADGGGNTFVTNACIANKRNTRIFFRSKNDPRLFLLNVGQRYSTRDGGSIEIINLHPELFNELGASGYLRYSSHICVYDDVEYKPTGHFMSKEADVVARRLRIGYETS